jgi:hypothetical protein
MKQRVRLQHKLLTPLAVALLSFGLVQAQQRSLVPIYDARLNPKPGQATRADINLLKRQVLPKDRVYWNKDDLAKQCASSGEAFAVRDVAFGSFTRPKARQRALLYHHCWLPGPGWGYHFSGIAVLESNRVVAHVPFMGGDERIGAYPDFDRNGCSELVTVESDIRMGIEYEWINVFELKGGERRELLELQTAQSNYSSGVERPGQFDSRAARVYVQPGPRLTFYAEVFKDVNAARATGKPKWQRLTPIKALLINEVDQLFRTP